MAVPLSISIPVRFILTIGHFIVTLLVFWHKDANIYAGFRSLPTASQYDDANKSIKAALALSMICFFFHFLGIVTGVSLFSGKMIMLQTFCQFVGGVLVAWFIVEQWSYGTFWYIWGFLSFIPAVAEVMILILTFGFKVFEY